METSVNSASPLPSTKIVNNIHSTIKTKLSSLSDSFKCQLCGGYIINATTINECLHSFCRSCIVKHFNCNHDCPKCGLKFSETSKWETLRMDSMLQSLIYKLIPGLFRSEMKLRKEFHSKSNDSPCDYFDEQKVYYQLDEKISVVLMYSKYSNDKSKKTIGSSKTSTSNSTSTSTTSSSSDEHRYLLCPAGFPIGSLKKFIYLKYELSSCFKVDIMFDDKILDDDLQLLDIVYIYSTQQPIPLHFKLNNFAVHKNNQTTTTSKSQINAIKKSMHNHSLASPSSTSLTSSSSSSSTKTSTSTSASSLNFHMKTTTTTSTASTNTPNNGNAKNDVKNDNTTLKSVAVQSSSVITCATSPMNPVSSSTSTVAPTRNSPSLSSQNIDKNQLEKSQLMNEREKQAMHSVSSSIKSSDTKRVIKPKVINTKLAPMVNQINLKRSTTSVLPCSTQVTTVTLNKQSKPSSVKTNKQSNMFVKSVELTNRETDKRFINGYDNIGFTPISCSQSTPKVTSTNTVSSTPSVSITATTMITTTSHGAKNNFISKHLSQMNNESEKRKESDCKSDKSEAPRKQMKVSQVNDKINSQLSVTSSNQNDSSKSPSAPTSPKSSTTQINTIDKAASNNVVNKITRDVSENCKTSHSVGTSISPNNSQTSVNTPKTPSSVITNTVSAGNSNVTNSQSNNKNNQSTNSEVKSNGLEVDDKVVKSSNANAIKAPSVSSSQSSTVTSKSLSSSSSSSSPHLVIAPSPSPSTSSSSPSPKLSSTSTSVSSSKPSTISTSTSKSSSSSCTSKSTPTSTKVVSSSFYPTSTSTSTSTSISRLINNQQQKVKQSGQGDKRQRESPSSSSPGNAPDNRPSKMVKISKNQTLNSQHKNLQIQHQQQQQQHQQLQQQYKLHQQMIGNHDQLTNDSVFNVKALIADEKEAALNKNSPQTGFTLKSMPVDLRNPRNMNKTGGLHAIPSGPFQHFHHFANPSSVLVPIATGSSGHSPGPYHESSFPHLKYLEYTKLMGEALMQHFHQANNSFGVTLNLNGNVNGNVNGKSMNNIQGELVKGFYKETLTNSPNRENDTKNDK